MSRDMSKFSKVHTNKLYVDEQSCFKGDAVFCKDVSIKGAIKGNLCIEGNLLEPFIQKKCEDFQNLRCLLPHEPEKLGSSISCQAQEFTGYPMQAGNEWSTGLKLEYNSEANKYSLPALSINKTFDLVPSSSEAGSMDTEIVAAGFTDRTQNNNWYGVTMDQTNFYYTVFGGGLFQSLFGFPPYGTSSLFVCRKRSDASLVWVKNSQNYSIETPNQPVFTGGTTRVSRVALAIYNDRLYITSMLTNLGPQLYCINKNTGAPIWSIAYQLPSGHPSAPGILRAPGDVAINSQDGTPYAGQTVAVGDLNISVVELKYGIPSVFVGLSSFQNAVNPSPTWSIGLDKGAVYRFDDMGANGSLVWKSSTCAPDLLVGDTITAGGPTDKDPFRPGQTEVIIWRESTDGRFAAAGGVIGKVMDNTSTYPGYRPNGYTGPGGPNNNTMPVAFSAVFALGSFPLSESNFPSIFRTPAPGVGSGVRIYQFYVDQASVPLSPSVPKTITDALTDMNTILPPYLTPLPPYAQSIRISVFAYLTQAEIDAVDAAAGPFLSANIGTRYAAALPDGYTLANSQEAYALNYFGNSVWGQSPIIDQKNGYVYFGTGQAHFIPLDEELTFQNPIYDFRQRAQPIVNSCYQYTQNDASLGSGPYSTLKDINDAKDIFSLNMLNDSIDPTLRSPRGNRSYSCAVMGVDLESGSIAFGARTVLYDVFSFVSEPLITINVRGYGVDADASSGVQFFDNVKSQNDDYGTYLAAATKGCCLMVLDISGLNRKVNYDHTNLLVKGVNPSMYYAGPLSALGGSNYGSAQSGGSYLIYQTHNKSTDIGGSGVRSDIYNDNYQEGWEFHVTRDGRAIDINQAMLCAFDVAKRQFVWEVNMGQESNTYPSVYNGIAYSITSTGTVIGVDIQTGEKIYSLDLAPYNIGGVAAPHFSDGTAIILNNYNFVGGGKKGNTGLTLKLLKEKLLTPAHTVSNLTQDYEFVSYDVVPKKKNPTVYQSPLLEPELISHIWEDNIVSATHAVTAGPVELVTATATQFVYQNQIMSLGNVQSAASIRYQKIKWLTCEQYILYYQRLESGVWVNYTATFKATVPIDTTIGEFAKST